MNVTGDILLPTAYFPPVSYVVFLLKSKNMYIEQMETFPRQTFRNRCEIMTVAGKTNLVVPVTKPQGNHTLTKNVEICYHEPWNRNHWKTLQAGYSSSPFFSYYADIFQPLFESRETHLVTLNHKILKIISGLIGINPSVEFTKDYITEQQGLFDLRKKMSPKRTRSFFEFPRYPQVFEYKYGFVPGLSILDLLFNVGPEARRYLEKILHSWTIEY